MLFRRETLAIVTAILLSIVVLVCAPASLADEVSPSIDFTRDVRPILADNCFQCHGPDVDHREADLRLDVWQAGGDIHGADAVVTPGKPNKSELVARITSDDPDVRMPPAASGKSLAPSQVETLRKWITDGAQYKRHWAFVMPRPPATPKVGDPAWVRNPIDAFVLARLDQEGLRPSPPAAPATLLRRLSLDLVGLPPTIDDPNGLQSLASEEAYLQQVERLLSSPHFGERWGRVWLDAARYADSDGYEKDKPRDVWMYRDWVINALNRDMPYDEFIVDQIAGDLLDSPTQDERVATGFLRNSMVNQEGGIDPEQFRMEAMFDRMDAIGKAILGITIQCAQCHSHKYDPLTHIEYYRMFAFLNNFHEGQITVYSKEEQSQWAATAKLIRRIEDRLKVSTPDWPARMAAWEESVLDDQPEWVVVRPQLDGSGGQKHYLLDDGSVLAQGYAPSNVNTEFAVDVTLPRITAVRLELLKDPNLPHSGPGRSYFGLCALTEFQAKLAPLDKPSEKSDVKFSAATADVNPAERDLDALFDNRSPKRRVVGPVGFAIDGNELTAWGIEIGPGRSNVPRKAVFVLDEPIENKDGVQITFTLKQQHGGWLNYDDQNNNLGRFRFSVTSAANPSADSLPSDVRAILQMSSAERTPTQLERVFSFWRTTVPEWQEENRRIEALWQSHPRGTSQLVAVERSERRPTHRLERGNFLQPTESAAPGVPSFLHALKENADGPPPSRLALARWLVDRRSPTTARAIVNRVWQTYFGTGLVATAEDLGTQGEPPSHPELLDWLAVEFMDHGWSLKHLHRLIVTSATYRQSSVVTPELLARDPANRLLARGARFRVDAEVVRDIALASSGLLSPRVGGPSVFPPAPEFLFLPPTSYARKPWNYSKTQDKYRRALYTFRYRSVPHPALQNFDAPSGEFACARRVRSNTPLQALTTLNEPLFMDCARALAAKILANGGNSDDERLKFAVRQCLSREPDEREMAVLATFVGQQRERFQREGANPWALLTENAGTEHVLPATSVDDANPAELAAWTALARVVLNLDETITKE